MGLLKMPRNVGHLGTSPRVRGVVRLAVAKGDFEGSSPNVGGSVVLAALPPLVERIRTLCRQTPGRDRDGSRNPRVILGQAPPGPMPPRPAQGTADAQDAARSDIHRGGHNHSRASSRPDATVQRPLPDPRPGARRRAPSGQPRRQGALGRFRPFRTARRARGRHRPVPVGPARRNAKLGAARHPRTKPRTPTPPTALVTLAEARELVPTIPAGNLRDVIWRSVQGFL